MWAGFFLASPDVAQDYVGMRHSRSEALESLTGYRLLRGQQRLQLRLRRDEDPCQQVSDYAGTTSRSDGEKDAEQAHQGYVLIEVLGQSGADSGDLSVGARAH